MDEEKILFCSNSALGKYVLILNFEITRIFLTIDQINDWIHFFNYLGVNFAEFVRHRENPTCFEMVGPPDWLNLWKIENQTHGYVDPVLLAVVEVFGDDTNLERKKK